MNNVDSQFYLSDKSGNLKFTQKGLEHLTPLFELAGIDINRVKTIQAYHQARKDASPFFMLYLSERADAWPDTDQFCLLKVAIFSDEEDLEQEINRYDSRKKLKFIK